MATGSLLIPLLYAPLHPTTGALVPGGKLRWSRTGTTTDQDTYSDSALQTPNANPVVLSADGQLETKVYGNPSSGFNYRLRFYDSSDVLLSTIDDIVCTQSDVATIQEGSFTGTLTGYATPPTGTVTYKVISNIGGTGKVCVLRIAAAITGTSNTTAMTMTGLPAACTPSVAVYVPTLIVDNNADNAGAASIAAAATTIVFQTDASLSATGFTNSGTKGLGTGWSLVYPL